MDPLAAALKVASSGLGAQSERLRVVSENLANAQTTGYLARRVSFSGDGTVRVLLDTEQGALESTGRHTDVAIEGSGFITASLNGRTVLTRNGTLFRWLSRSSAEALQMLHDDSVHVGGVHLRSNEAAVQR